MVEHAGIEYPFTFHWSAGVEQFFVDQEVYLKNAFKVKNIWKVGEKIIMPLPAIVEPFAAMAGRAGFVSAGAFTYAHSSFGGNARVGRYCSIAPGSRLMGNEHPLDRISTHPFACRDYYNTWTREKYGLELGALSYEKTRRGPLVVGHDVWIGGQVLIRPGVTIGTGAVVAAGSVVVKDVPPYAIVGGNPARVIRYRFDEATVERLLRVAWWRFHVLDFSGLEMSDPHAFLDGLEARIGEGTVREFTPEPIDLGANIRRIRREELRARSAKKRQSATP
jgi:Acetyltransferase (isoleucine patch superfamily)